MGFWHDRGDRPTLVSGTHAFYVNALLRGLVMSLVGVFTPIFVYREMGLWWVALYYLILRLTVFLAAIPASHIIEKVGFRKSVALSMLFLTGNLVVLSLASSSSLLIPLAGVLAGLVIPFYWIARHSAVSQDAKKGGMGRTMGLLATMESIASLLAPFVGGVMIMKWGYPVLYGISAVLLVLSMIPLWYMPPHTHKNGASLAGLSHFLNDRRYFHQAVSMMGLVGYDYGLLIIWPLMMYMMHFSTAEVGGVFSLAAVVWVILRMVTGNIFDKLHNKIGYADEKVFAVSVLLVGVSIIARLFIHDLTTIVIVEIATALSAIVYHGFLMSYFQIGGQRMGSIAYYVYGEMVYSAMVVILMLLFLTGIYFGIWQEMVILVCASWVITSIIVARESNMR